jgi:BirA family biotin operon repressor/biotin-[acetyl-CoA-carboxylase] ligase
VDSTRAEDSLLLGRLFAALGDFISRPELVTGTGVTTAGLESRFAPYVEAGYPIAFHPQRGVSLGEPPDIWCAEEILGRCPARDSLPAWEPLLLTETGSTNDIAREQGRRGAAAGFLAAAARQTRGRGRLGRAWDSAAGLGLYVSLLLRPALAARDAGRLSVLASVSAADAVETLTGRRPQIKWPNDLLLDGRKLAGLLIETEPAGAMLAFAVIGIGINIGHEAADFPPELQATATSLRLAIGRLYRRADLLVALLRAFERRLAEPFETTRQAWAASSLTLGQQVTLSTLRGTRHGQAIGLDETGALLLRDASGAIEPVTAGDMQAV